MNLIRNVLLFIVVALVPFYSWDPVGLQGEISLPGLIALFYAGISLINFSSALSLRDLKPFILPLIFLLLWMCFISFLNLPLVKSGPVFHYTFFQFIILIIIIVNHIKNDQRLIYAVLLVYCMGVVVLSFLFKYGIGTSYAGTRMTIFNDNANNVAIRATIAIIVFLSLAFTPEIKTRLKYVLLFFIPQLYSIITTTASRGALISLISGILLMILFLKKTATKIFVLLVIGFLLLNNTWNRFFFKDDELYTRMMLFFRYGDETREDIYKKLLPAVWENPVTGVGQNGYIKLTHDIFGIYTSPHNWFLYVLLTCGIIGLSSFLIFFFRLFQQTVSLYRIRNMALPGILLFIIVFNIFKAGNQLTDFSVWFIVMVIIAWGIYLKKLQAESESVSE